MASHKSTPATILDAPLLQPVVTHPAIGLSRAERRHGTTMKRKLATVGRHNHPYVKPQDEER